MTRTPRRLAMHVDRRGTAVAKRQAQRPRPHRLYIKRHPPERAVQDVRTDQRDAVAVKRREQRCVRVIQSDRDIPTAAGLAAVQAGQQPRGVVRVGIRHEQRGQ